jgi:Ca2+-binding EF-hand superfamily protein
MHARKPLITAVVLSLVLSGSAVMAKGKPNQNGHGGQNNGGQNNGGNNNGGNNGNHGGNNGGGGEDLTHIRFAGLDTNHDGQISRSEWRGNDASFNEHDWNGDGVLSGIEVTPGAQRPVDFNSLDRNDDNRIAPSEWPGSRALFNLLDANHDGFLSQQEFGTFGSVFARGNLDEIFRALDTNSDNRIARTEWLGDTAIFDRLDTNHDGFLTLAELRRLNANAGDDDDEDDDAAATFNNWDTNHDSRLSLSEWRGNSRNFNRLDTNHDGFLSLEEFLRR